MSEDKEIKDQEEVLRNEEVQDESFEQTEEVKEPTQEERYAELNDRFLRLHADFENFRKRTNKERIDLIVSASEGVLKEMLPIIDDFERAIANNEHVQDVNSLKEGFNLIYQKFKLTLENKGLKAMDSKGQVFDSELHEAIANLPAPTDADKGKVLEIAEKGYYLNDKVVRFAKVVVGQ